jgi:hypothetical protein
LIHKLFTFSTYFFYNSGKALYEEKALENMIAQKLGEDDNTLISHGRIK